MVDTEGKDPSNFDIPCSVSCGSSVRFKPVAPSAGLNQNRDLHGDGGFHLFLDEGDELVGFVEGEIEDEFVMNLQKQLHFDQYLMKYLK